MICPVCLSVQNQRKNGKCPACGVLVELIDGEWIVSAKHSPNVILVEFFERMVSEQQSALRDSLVVFCIPRKGMMWKRELRSAKNLIQQAGSLERAMAAIRFLFNDDEFRWKTRSSLCTFKDDFLLAVAIVKAEEEKLRAKEDAIYQETMRQLRGREDLFK